MSRDKFEKNSKTLLPQQTSSTLGSIINFKDFIAVIAATQLLV